MTGGGEENSITSSAKRNTHGRISPVPPSDLPVIDKESLRRIIYQKLDELRHGDLFMDEGLEESSYKVLLDDNTIFDRFVDVLGSTWNNIDMARRAVCGDQQGLNGGKLKKRKKLATKAIKLVEADVRNEIQIYQRNNADTAVLSPMPGGNFISAQVHANLNNVSTTPRALHAEEDYRSNNSNPKANTNVNDDGVSSINTNSTEGRHSRSSSHKKKKSKKHSKTKKSKTSKKEKKKRKDKDKSTKKRSKKHSDYSDPERHADADEHENADGFGESDNMEEEYDQFAHSGDIAQNVVLSRTEAQQEFEKQKEYVLKHVDKEVKKDFRKCGFSKWNKDYLPILQVGPYDVPPADVRDQWMKMFENCRKNKRPMTRLVYWYGTTRDDFTNGYSFVQAKTIISYEAGCERGFDKPPAKIQKKIDSGKALSKGDQLIIAGLEELKNEYKLPPEERLAWIEVEEDHEGLDVGKVDVDMEQQVPVEVEVETQVDQDAKPHKDKKKGKKRKKMDTYQKEDKPKRKDKRKKTAKEDDVTPEKKKSKNVVVDDDDEKIDEMEVKKSKTKKSKKKLDNDEIIADEVRQEAIYDEETEEEDDEEKDENFEFRDVEDNESDEDLPQQVIETPPKKVKSKEKSTAKKIPRTTAEEDEVAKEERLKERRLHDFKKREEKRKKECEQNGLEYIPREYKPKKNAEHILEQKRLEKCEKIFLPIMKDLKSAIDAIDETLARKYLGDIQTDIAIITPPFIREHGLGLLIKETRRAFDNNGMKALCKKITSEMREIFNEKDKNMPKDFVPKVTKLFETPSMREDSGRKSPFKTDEITPSTSNTNLTGLAAKESAIKIKSESTIKDEVDQQHQHKVDEEIERTPSSLEEKNGSITKDAKPLQPTQIIAVIPKVSNTNTNKQPAERPPKIELAETPKVVKTKPKQKFSLKRMLETPKAPSSVDVAPDKIAYQTPVKMELPKWLTMDPPNDDSFREHKDRALAMEFFMDAANYCFGNEEVGINPISIVRALESAAFEWSKDNSRLYWEKVQELVGAMVGKRKRGSLALKIVAGDYNTPMDVVKISIKKTFQSFEGYQMT